MSDSEQDPKAEFNKIVDHAAQAVYAASTGLMDIQHETIQNSRAIIRELRQIQGRFNECIENIIIAHAIGAREMAELYGDVISAELGIEEATEQEAEEGDGWEDEQNA